MLRFLHVERRAPLNPRILMRFPLSSKRNSFGVGFNDNIFLTTSTPKSFRIIFLFPASVLGTS